MKSILVAGVLALAAASSAAGQGLPPSVAEPYRAYQSAVEAGDEMAALDPAYRAWQAGEREEIDAETIGLLADNYAALASTAGHHAQAAAAFARSAGILADTEGRTVLTAQTWRLAATSAYQAEDNPTAERYALQAVTVLRGVEAGADRAREAFQSRSLLAYIAYEAGRIQPAGDHARAALEALEPLGPVSTRDTANMAFFAGVEESLDGNNIEAGYYFGLATVMFEATGADSQSRRSARAWVQYLRNQMDERERRQLEARLDEAGYLPADCIDGVTCDATPLAELYPDAVEVIEAHRVDYVAPVYPVEMENNGVEGLALISYNISEEGRIVDVEVLYSVPHSSFAAAGLEAMENWRYEPMTVDGVPTRREGQSSQFIYVLTPNNDRAL